MINIQVKDNSEDAFNRAFQTFKKVCNKDGFLKEVRDRRYYKKPSQKKHDKTGEVKRRMENERKKQKKYDN